MNNRLRTLAVTLLIIILISNFVSAIQVTDIAQGIEATNSELTSLKATINSKFAIMDSKLDNYATKDDISNLLTAHLITTNQIIDNFRSILIVSFIVIGMCLVGLGYSIFFYFKGRGRI